MSIRKILWKGETTNFTGRNGFMKCSGVEVLPASEGEIILSPLTSKGAVGRCDIWLELESVPELITALQHAYNEQRYVAEQQEKITNEQS